VIDGAADEGSRFFVKEGKIKSGEGYHNGSAEEMMGIGLSERWN